MTNRCNKTHVEDVEDPKEVLLPSHNLVFITLGMEESGGHVPFTLLDNLPLDLAQGSVIEGISKWTVQNAHRWFDSRSQTSDRFEDGLVELIQSSAFQSPVERLTYISTSPPKVDIILIVGYRILGRRESGVQRRRVDENVPEG